MTRQVVLTFFGEPRYLDAGDAGDAGDAVDAVDAGDEMKPHESPWTMTLPRVALAVLSVVGGVIQLPFSSSTK